MIGLELHAEDEKHPEHTGQKPNAWNVFEEGPRTNQCEQDGNEECRNEVNAQIWLEGRQ